MNKDELIKKALEARENAYVPYSKFKVGAAILTKDGKYHFGANIENSSYGLTCCAERNCLFGAYSNGVKKEDIVAMAIIGDTNAPISPCGACRQVMSELLPFNTIILLSNLKGDIKETSLKELLPFAFDGSDF